MIAQLVERSTVVWTQLDILRSLVRLRFAGSQLSFSLQESILHGRSNIITNTSMGCLSKDCLPRVKMSQNLEVEKTIFTKILNEIISIQAHY